MAKMTKQQAIDKLEKAVGKLMEDGQKQLDTGMPKLQASAKKLEALLKADQSPEQIQMQAKHLQLQMRTVAEGAVKLDQALKAVQELEKDEEFFELTETKILDLDLDEREVEVAGREVLAKAAAPRACRPDEHEGVCAAVDIEPYNTVGGFGVGMI